MEELLWPLLILGVGGLVAVLFYLPFEINSENKNKLTDQGKLGKNSKEKIGVSIDIWQGIKFGLGFGIGLILTTGIFWLLIGSFLIVSVRSILSAAL